MAYKTSEKKRAQVRESMRKQREREPEHVAALQQERRARFLAAHPTYEQDRAAYKKQWRLAKKATTEPDASVV